MRRRGSPVTKPARRAAVGQTPGIRSPTGEATPPTPQDPSSRSRPLSEGTESSCSGRRRAAVGVAARANDAAAKQPRVPEACAACVHANPQHTVAIARGTGEPNARREHCIARTLPTCATSRAPIGAAATAGRRQRRYAVVPRMHDNGCYVELRQIDSGLVTSLPGRVFGRAPRAVGVAATAQARRAEAGLRERRDARALSTQQHEQSPQNAAFRTRATLALRGFGTVDSHQHRARSAGRSKPSPRGVRGSGTPAGSGDESATGSVNFSAPA